MMVQYCCGSGSTNKLLHLIKDNLILAQLYIRISIIVAFNFMLFGIGRCHNIYVDPLKCDSHILIVVCIQKNGLD